MLIAIVIAKKIFDTKIHRIYKIPNDFFFQNETVQFDFQKLLLSYYSTRAEVNLHDDLKLTLFGLSPFLEFC